MELLSVSLTGYKRFKKTTSLQTNGKLIALLGPNEAGKSSLLQAIAHLAHGEAITTEEQSRDIEPKNLRIIGRFFLNEAELGSAGLSGPHSMIVTKKVDGKRTFGFDPAAPDRDVSHRKLLVSSLCDVLANTKVAELLDAHDESLRLEVVALGEELRDAGESLIPSVLETLNDLSRRLELANGAASRSDVKDLLKKIRSAIELEIAPTPLNRAFDALHERVPDLLLFDEKARDLASNYSLSELRNAVPPALANLAEVAGLDFTELFNAIDAGQTARITTIERKASRTLSQKFRLAWQQSGLEVALRIQADTLEVQIVNGETEFTPLAERSDGLRQFVALQMFATRNHVDQPVLLIDEADQRLHYDAQADLVQMLAKQQLAPKVIYTTHSAGCLPEDLGNGVRTVIPSEKDGTSAVVNRFWSGRERGLTPILIGLGASTMAFFPTRRAVMVEGPSDMLLYPTLFREALQKISLGFQFVPGLSSFGEEQALAVGTSVVYLVDGDRGGKAIEERLIGLGIASDDIYVMRNKSRSALELEDFVLEDRLIEAANVIIKKWHSQADCIAKLEGEDGTRMDKLESAFKQRTGVSLPKVDLAYGLLDLCNADPHTKLIDPKRIDGITAIAKSIFDRFDRATVIAA